MKTIVALITFCFLLTVNSWAQSEGFITVEKVPKIVQKKFKLLYPKEEIGKAAWEYENGSHEAYMKNEKGSTEDALFFSAEGKLEYRIFTADGIRTGTEKEVNTEALPEAIRMHLSETHKGKIIRASVVKFDLEEKN